MKERGTLAGIPWPRAGPRGDALDTSRTDGCAPAFSERQVQQLPILNRNFTQFELLTPGTQYMTAFQQNQNEDPQGGQQIMVNGGVE